MFESLRMAPPDAILGLSEAFQKDPRPGKINLSVGVFKDAAGKTPVLASVKEAERRLLAGEVTKSYLPIEGSHDFARHVQQLLLGPTHDVVKSHRAATVHTPGGTAALRVAADFLKQNFPACTVWCSKPTWPNHPSVFNAAGLRVESYPYFDAAANALDFAGMLAALQKIPAGDVVLLHACCHNPSGIDPTPEQWRQIGAALKSRGLLALVDFAYQGFGDGLVEDAVGLVELLGSCPELLVASSFSKNFGLYNERVGALTAVAGSAEQALTALSQLKTCVRANYSNPPAHGAAVVSTILADAELRSRWEQELKEMRDRINGMRRQFVEAMKARCPQRDFSYITRQRGMFSFSGLTPMQVDALKNEYAVYVVGSGRINVAGMTEDNMPRLCDAIATVLQSA